jgi:hypothetical protein
VQIVAGVLTKWVNLGQGWRHRLFVLRHGVLRYYRVRRLESHSDFHIDAGARAATAMHTMQCHLRVWDWTGLSAAVRPWSVQVMGLAHKANIHQMFEVLRSEGDLQLIGAEAGILENKWRKWAPATDCCLGMVQLLSALEVGRILRNMRAHVGCRQSNGTLDEAREALADPQAEVHLQVGAGWHRCMNPAPAYVVQTVGVLR